MESDPDDPDWNDIERIYCFDLDSFSDADWKTLHAIYAQLPNHETHSEDQFPRWFSKIDDPQNGYLWASVEPPGLQVAGTLRQMTWDDWDLSRWMQWLMTCHVRRYHRNYKTSGHVWQGRFKAFPIQSDEHLLTVLRYVERNPVRAKTISIRKAPKWSWSSAGKPSTEFETVRLHRGPVKRRDDWLDWVNQPLTVAERDSIRTCVQRGRPFGSEKWQKRTAKRLDLESTMRPRGRPKKLKK